MRFQIILQKKHAKKHALKNVDSNLLRCFNATVKNTAYPKSKISFIFIYIYKYNCKYELVRGIFLTLALNIVALISRQHIDGYLSHRPDGAGK